MSDPTRPAPPRAPIAPRTGISPKAPNAGVRPAVSPPRVPSRPPPAPPAASPAPPVVVPAANVPAVAPAGAARRLGSDEPPPEDAWGAPPAAKQEAPRLTSEMRVEVQALVRTQVEEAVAPVARAIGDLRAEIEKDRRVRTEATPPPVPAKKASFESLVPAAASPWAETPLGPPVHLTPSPDLEPTPAIAPAATPAAPAADPLSIPISMAPSAPPPQQRVIDLEPGLHVEIPAFLDGSRRRRRMGIFVAFFVLLVVGGLLSAMIASRS